MKGVRIAKGKALFHRGEAYYPGDERKVIGLDEKAVGRLIQLGILIRTETKEEEREEEAPEAPVYLSATPLADANAMVTPTAVVLKRKRKRKLGKKERMELRRERQRTRGYKPAREGAEEDQLRLMAEVNAIDVDILPAMLANVASSWEVIRMRYLDKRPRAKAHYDVRLRELANV